MALDLPPDEPPAGPWTAVTTTDLLALLRSAAPTPSGRPLVVAVDGRGASGKSTLADRLHAAVAASTVVHTDDIAWNHAFFAWADLLADGVLEPARRGEPVSYRPPAWDRHGRAGAVEVPAGLDLLVVEGVGAGRRDLAHLLDAVVWVQSDLVEAERRGLERDVASGVNGDHARAKAFWDEWMAEELAFLAEQRPWERARAVVAGTPDRPLGEDEVLVAPPPAAG